MSEISVETCECAISRERECSISSGRECAISRERECDTSSERECAISREFKHVPSAAAYTMCVRSHDIPEAPQSRLYTEVWVI